MLGLDPVDVKGRSLSECCSIAVPGKPAGQRTWPLGVPYRSGNLVLGLWELRQGFHQISEATESPVGCMTRLWGWILVTLAIAGPRPMFPETVLMVTAKIAKGCLPVPCKWHRQTPKGSS